MNGIAIITMDKQGNMTIHGKAYSYILNNNLITNY